MLQVGLQVCICIYYYYSIHVLVLICVIITGLSMQTAVTISSTPAGSGSNSTFDYPTLNSVTLTCMVDPSPSSTIDYQWNTTGCYTNINYNGGVPRCFPHDQTTQSVTENDVTAEDAGTITCSVTVNGWVYTSDPIILYISGKDVLYYIL